MAVAPDKFYTARVTFRRHIAQDLCILRLDPGGEFKFVPGQYATVGVRLRDKLVERAYSIASSPHEAEIELFLELVPQGRLTPALYALELGAELSLRKTAKGRFTLDIASGHRNHLLLCTVTGVAPYISFVRTLCRDWAAGGFQRDIHLYLVQGASRSWEFGYREELAGMASQVPWLTYVPTVSRAREDPSWTGERGRVEDIVRKYTDSWGVDASDTTAYLCGHAHMVENGTRILERIGFTKESIRQEIYWVPKEAEGRDP
jgi:ferredoxin/flavodoxin---NADP+ reductase